jgi:predicted solute-binding protein
VLTGLPLPLGANAVRLDLDRQHGPGTVQRLVNVLHASLRHARTHHARSSEYAWKWSSRKLPLRELGEQYLDLYVSSLTDDATGRGERAIHEFHRRAAAIGALPAIEAVHLLSAQ